MRKFLSVIGLIFLTVVLVVVGVIGAISLKDVSGVNAAEHAIQLALIIGGFGGAIATGVLSLANFFTAKTRDKE